MKKIFLTLSSLFFGLSTYGQNVYYDSRMLIDQHLAFYDETLGFAEILLEEDQLSVLFGALHKYLTPDEKDQILPDSSNIKDVFVNAFKGNPYVQFSGETRQGLRIGGLSLNQITNRVAGMDVTTFADGLAQFLIERANEEINVWFFRRLRNELRSSVELRTIFPTTARYLVITEPYQYAQMINVLREAFRKDLRELIDNMEALATLDKYQELFKKHEELKFVAVGLAGASIVSKLKKGIHPADVIDSLAARTYLRGAGDNLFSGVRLLSLVSQSIRDTTEGKGYVEVNAFKTNILQHPDAFHLYMGLLWQQCVGVSFSTASKDSISVRSFLAVNKQRIVGSRSFGLAMVDRFNTLEQTFDALRRAGDAHTAEYTDWYNFYDAVLDVVETGINASVYFPQGTLEIPPARNLELKKYMFVARLGNEVFRNVHEKKFSLAILNFSIAYDTLFRKHRGLLEDVGVSFREDVLAMKTEVEQAFALLQSKLGTDVVTMTDQGEIRLQGAAPVKWNEAMEREFHTTNIKRALKAHVESFNLADIIGSKFLRYGAFMAAVSEAESPDAVKAAIRAAALPAGSSVIKRETSWNISINSYIGAHYGNEYLEPDLSADDWGWSTIAGLSAPLGLAVSKQMNFPFKSGSISLFASLIDVGAIASFRLEDDATEQLPAIKLENIVAPGIHLVYGIPKTPLSIGYGWQRGPQLREVHIPDPAGGEPTNRLVSGYRWAIFVAVDIPLFNIYTRPR